MPRDTGPRIVGQHWSRPGLRPTAAAAVPAVPAPALPSTGAPRPPAARRGWSRRRYPGVRRPSTFRSLTLTLSRSTSIPPTAATADSRPDFLQASLSRTCICLAPAIYIILLLLPLLRLLPLRFTLLSLHFFHRSLRLLFVVVVMTFLSSTSFRQRCRTNVVFVKDTTDGSLLEIVQQNSITQFIVRL